MSDARTTSGAAPGGDGATAGEEEIDLEPDLRKSVLDLHGRIEALDYYSLLGVDREADRKTVKRAYYEAAAKFHPDRHFRKKLGSFKVKMEVIFARFTLAHDTLSDGTKRAEYDAYLQARRRSQSIEELLENSLAEFRRVEENVERQARMSASGAAAAPAPAPPAPAATRPPSGGTPPGAQPAPSPAVDAAARRDALARRLLGGRLPGASSVPPAARSIAPERPTPTPAEAIESLRRRYEERVLLAKTAQARRYVEKAQHAMAADDPVAAANALRVAKNLVPDDPEVARLASEAQTKANVIVGRTYAQQAEYEEKNGHWPEASRSYGRACAAWLMDARVHERAANALLKAAGDLHEAARLAKRACELEPSSAPARVTLASVYLAAGLTLNARRELEAAAQLAPHDDTIRELLKKSTKTA